VAPPPPRRCDASQFTPDVSIYDERAGYPMRARAFSQTSGGWNAISPFSSCLPVNRDRPNPRATSTNFRGLCTNVSSARINQRECRAFPRYATKSEISDDEIIFFQASKLYSCRRGTFSRERQSYINQRRNKLNRDIARGSCHNLNRIYGYPPLWSGRNTNATPRPG